MSTTTIKQGVQYEITADDKASQTAKKAADNVAAASEKSGQAAASAGKAAAQGAQEGTKGFNAMRAASSALRGDFTSMGQELSKLFSKSSKDAAHAVASIGAIGTAISAVCQFASSLKTLFEHAFNLNIDKSFSKASSQLADLKNKASEFAAALADANAAAQKQTAHLAAQIDASNRLSKALSDVARQKELADASSDEQRDAINAKYDLANAASDESSRSQKLALQRKALQDEVQRLQDQIAASRDRERQARDAEKRFANRASAEFRDSSVLGDTLRSWFRVERKSEQALKFFDTATAFRNQATQESDLQDQLKERIADIRRQQEILRIERRAQSAEDSARHIKEDAATAAAQDAAFERRFAADLQRIQTYYGDDWRTSPMLTEGEDAVRSLAIQREQDKQLADFSELDSISQNTAYLRQIYTLLAQE